eukprot:429024-Pyramimonas_sp.AAC.1
MPKKWFKYLTYIPCRQTAIGWPTVDSGACASALRNTRNLWCVPTTRTSSYYRSARNGWGDTQQRSGACIIRCTRLPLHERTLMGPGSDALRPLLHSARREAPD